MVSPGFSIPPTELYPQAIKGGCLPMVTSRWWQAPRELRDLQQTAVMMVKDPRLGIPGL